MDSSTGALPGTRRSLIERMIGAALLDVSVYEEVEADRTATGQAAAVVAIVAICGAVGNLGQHSAKGPIGAVIAAFLGWMLMAGLTYVVGTRLFKGTADWGEMLRTLGFAQTPGVIAILGLIPILGRLVIFAVAIWQLVTAVVAIRQALDFDTQKAIFTALISWLIVWIVIATLMFFVLGTAMAVGAVTG
jgi:hypothetical protein